MRVVVGGSSGLIGSALCNALAEAGDEVIPLVRPDSKSTTGVKWDPKAGTIDTESLGEVDAVVNLGGVGVADKRWSDSQKQAILDSRVDSTTLLAKTVAAMPNKPVFISGSAIGYYGNTVEPLRNESSPAGTDFLAGVCVKWERATAVAEDAGCRVAHIRTGHVLSAKGGALGKMLPLFKLGVGGRVGDGKSIWSWISMTDEIRVIRYLIETKSASGAFNLCAPNSVTNAELAKTLGHVLHRPSFCWVPAFAPKILFGDELVNDILLSQPRVEAVRLPEIGFTFQHTDLEDALRFELDRPAQNT